MKTGIIYTATSPSGKIYIGQTIQTLSDRKKGHKNSANHYDHKFARAIKKYGIDSFDWKILCEDVPVDKLDRFEKLWIIKLDTYKNGYNSDKGGKTRRGYRHSEKVKKKISESHKGIMATKDTKRKISEANKKRVMTKATKRKLSEANKGKKLSYKTRKKISEAGKGRIVSEKTKSKISGELNHKAKLNWEQIAEIREKYKTNNYTKSKLAKEYGVHKTSIGNIINNKSWKTK